MTLAEMFEAENEEFLKFERIDNPKHITPDICAFLMLSAQGIKGKRGGRWHPSTVRYVIQRQAA